MPLMPGCGSNRNSPFQLPGDSNGPSAGRPLDLPFLQVAQFLSTSSTFIHLPSLQVEFDFLSPQLPFQLSPFLSPSSPARVSGPCLSDVTPASRIFRAGAWGVA